MKRRHKMDKFMAEDECCKPYSLKCIHSIDPNTEVESKNQPATQQRIMQFGLNYNEN